MELTAAIRRRRMTRAYDPDRPIPRDTLQEMLDLAIRAPSAGFSQGWHFLVLDEPGAREAFWSATSEGEPDSWTKRLQTAPVLIICFSDKQAYLDRYAEADKGWTDRDEAHWPVPYWDIDTGMAALLLLLAAEDRDLGACFFGVPAETWPALRAAFALPDRLTPVGVVSLGHRAPDVRSPSLKRGRRDQPDVVSYGSFGTSAEPSASG
jgi:nitroreductase